MLRTGPQGSDAEKRCHRRQVLARERERGAKCKGAEPPRRIGWGGTNFHRTPSPGRPSRQADPSGPRSGLLPGDTPDGPPGELPEPPTLRNASLSFIARVSPARTPRTRRSAVDCGKSGRISSIKYSMGSAGSPPQRAGASAPRMLASASPSPAPARSSVGCDGGLPDRSAMEAGEAASTALLSQAFATGRR